MKKLFLHIHLLLALLLTVPAGAAVQHGQEHGYEVTKSPASKPEAVVKQILAAEGLKQNFILLEANVPNAAAATMSGKHYILYNQKFLNLVSKAARTNWTTTFIFAHEIAHLHKGHLYNTKGNTLAMELEADEFAGSVLRKMNATLAETLIAVKVMSDEKDNVTHPGRTKRLAAAERGWRKADTGRQQQPILAQRHIYRQVHLYSKPNQPLYLTTKMNLVAIDNNKILMMGKAKKKSNRVYLVLGREKLYLTKDGYLVNKKHQRIGHLTKPANL